MASWMERRWILFQSSNKTATAAGDSSSSVFLSTLSLSLSVSFSRLKRERKRGGKEEDDVKLQCASCLLNMPLFTLCQAEDSAVILAQEAAFCCSIEMSAVAKKGI
jgi:hypothetical protein